MSQDIQSGSPLATTRQDTSRRGRAVMFMLGAAGVAILAVSLTSLVRKPSLDGPGMLVARQPTQVWRSPEVKDGRKPPNRAEVRFTFTNRGATDVNILSASSGCGCATPTIHPNRIRPGQDGVMDVSAMSPPLGERTVAFMIKTDSSRTPEIPFRLRLISSREPPFVLLVRGDLTFAGDFKPGESREFHACTIVTKQDDARPIITSDLPFLKIDTANMTTEPYGEDDSLLRTYHYSARLEKLPSEETVNGTVTVTDPWDTSLVYKLPVYIHREQDLVVTPSTLALNLQSSTDTETVATFLVKRKSASEEIRIQEASSRPIFKIHQSDLNATGRVTVVSVRLAANQSVATGDRELIVRTDSGRQRILPIRINVRSLR